MKKWYYFPSIVTKHIKITLTMKIITNFKIPIHILKLV